MRGCVLLGHADSPNLSELHFVHAQESEKVFPSFQPVSLVLKSVGKDRDK